MDFSKFESEHGSTDNYHVAPDNKVESVNKVQEMADKNTDSFAAAKVANRVAHLVSVESLGTPRLSSAHSVKQKVLEELQNVVKSKKNFARILDDSHRTFALHTVSNSMEEGNYFAPALIIYSSSLKEMGGDLRTRVSDKLLAASDKMQALILKSNEFHEEWDALANRKSLSQADVTALAEKHSANLISDWVKQINGLTEGQDLVFPGITPAHAALFRFSKNKAGNFELTIFNSGQGLVNHKSIRINGKKKFFTSLTKNNIPPSEIESLIKVIFYAQFAPELDKYDPNPKGSGYAWTVEHLYHFVKRLSGDEFTWPTDPLCARTEQKGESCSKEAIDAYYFDEELRYAQATGASVTEGRRRYKASQSKLKVQQLGLIIRDLSSRLEHNDVTDEEIRTAAFAISKVENYWNKHGLKVLSYQESGINFRAFFAENKKSKSMGSRLVKALKPYY